MIVLGIAYGAAIAAWVVLAVRTAQRYPGIPARFPVSTDLGGNPTMWGPRAAAWLAPAILAALIGMLGFAFTRTPRHGEQVVLPLVMLVVAGIAPLMMWISTGRSRSPGASVRASRPANRCAPPRRCWPASSRWRSWRPSPAGSGAVRRPG